MQLYKDRYLLARYELDPDGKDEHCVMVGTTPKEVGLKDWERVRRALQKKTYAHGFKLFAIDCLEKHDDVFAEEDNIFLKMCYTKEDKRRAILEYSKTNNLTIESVKSLLCRGTLKYEDGKIFYSGKLK